MKPTPASSCFREHMHSASPSIEKPSHRLRLRLSAAAVSAVLLKGTSLSLSLSLSISLTFSLYLTFSLALSLSHSLCISHSLSFWVSHVLSLAISPALLLHCHGLLSSKGGPSCLPLHYRRPSLSLSFRHSPHWYTSLSLCFFSFFLFVYVLFCWVDNICSKPIIYACLSDNICSLSSIDDW